EAAAAGLDPHLERRPHRRHVHAARQLEERARAAPRRRGRVRAVGSAERAPARERRLVRAQPPRLPLHPGRDATRVLELRGRDDDGGLLRGAALSVSAEVVAVDLGASKLLKPWGNPWFPHVPPPSGRLCRPGVSGAGGRLLGPVAASRWLSLPPGEARL